MEFIKTIPQLFPKTPREQEQQLQALEDSGRGKRHILTLGERS